MQRPIAPNPYKARLSLLGLTQASILPEIREMTGMSVNATELCAALNGVGVQTKHQCILKAVDELLCKYEKASSEEAQHGSCP